jgi:hypothetical protein
MPTYAVSPVVSPNAPSCVAGPKREVSTFSRNAVETVACVCAPRPPATASPGWKRSSPLSMTVPTPSAPIVEPIGV